MFSIIEKLSVYSNNLLFTITCNFASFVWIITVTDEIKLLFSLYCSIYYFLCINVFIKHIKNGWFLYNE